MTYEDDEWFKRRVVAALEERVPNFAEAYMNSAGFRAMIDMWVQYTPTMVEKMVEDAISGLEQQKRLMEEMNKIPARSRWLIGPEGIKHACINYPHVGPSACSRCGWDPMKEQE